MANELKENIIGGKYQMGINFGRGAFGEIYMGRLC